MATAPAFASTPRAASALLGAVETDLQVPTQSSTVFTAGASGSKVEEIVVQASKAASLVATTVAGLVYIFLHDGTTFHAFDTITVTAITASATTPGFRGSNRYANLFLPTGWSVRMSQSQSSNQNVLKATVLGADL